MEYFLEKLLDLEGLLIPKLKKLDTWGRLQSFILSNPKPFLTMAKSIIVAIDEVEADTTSFILEQLDPKKCLIKIGSILFNSLGHNALDLVSERGFEIFLDLKFHDIPNTVNSSIKSFKNKNIKMFTVHLSGGLEMVRSAKEASDYINSQAIGVSVLTSLSFDEIESLYNQQSHEAALELFNIADQANISGIVCSPHELDIANQVLPNMIKITPGIRPKNNTTDDQKRVMTPQQAINLGADYIVIGRPITLSPNIGEAFIKIYNDLNDS